MNRILLVVFAGGLFIATAGVAAAGSMARSDWTIRDQGRSGPQITRDMGWKGSERFTTSVYAEIDYRQGPTPELTVTGPKDLVDDLVLEGGALAWRDDHRGSNNDPPLIISVTGPNTHQFVLSGAQKLTIEGFDQESLELALSGASRVKAGGRARRVDLKVSGAGDLDLANLAVDDAVVRISGAGTVAVAPKASADLHISGSGNVNLLTRPPSLQTQISGAGAITYP